MSDAELENRFKCVEEWVKENTYRLNGLEKKQDQIGTLMTNVSLIAQRQDSMERDVSEVKEDVKTLIGRPGRRWEGVVDKIVMTAVGALIAYAAVQLGL